MEKIKLGISSCLLGESVRYDGNHKHDRYITDTLGLFFEFEAVCPEVECGLTIPREAMRLVGDPQAPRLMTIKSQIDYTDQMNEWIEQKLAALAALPLAGFIFKTRSPSSGMVDAKIYSAKGVVVKKGPGLFARAFMAHFPLIPVIDEGRLSNPVLRENFIERVFLFRQWQDLRQHQPTPAALLTFHTINKLLIMSHSVRHLSLLGRIVARRGKELPAALMDQYGQLLMECFGLIATAKKHTNVLQHMAGYFKKQLSPDQKQELQEVIMAYHDGLLPLIVPITLIKHYVRFFAEPYLQMQTYLNPHPLELMLRNHV
jgi:uncharacterized protein YbgA (DUF1722 family)/uncharacterized protein YbbK (DUF523 family)